MQKNSDAQIALFVRDEKTMYLISLYSIGWKSAALCRGESVQKETLSKSKGPMTWSGQAHPGRREAAR